MSQRRDKQKERFWRRALKRQTRGRETIRAFCEREGLAETAFHFWRRELARRDGQVVTARATRVWETSAASGSPSPSRPKIASSPRRPARRGTSRAGQSVGKSLSSGVEFAPLTILPPRAATTAPVELLLPSGVTLRIGSDAPWELVARVLDACGLPCDTRRAPPSSGSCGELDQRRRRTEQNRC